MKVYDNRVHCYPYACWKREGQVPDANRHSICATITITIKYTVKNKLVYRRRINHLPEAMAAAAVLNWSNRFLLSEESP